MHEDVVILYKPLPRLKRHAALNILLLWLYFLCELYHSNALVRLAPIITFDGCSISGTTGFSETALPTRIIGVLPRKFIGE